MPDPGSLLLDTCAVIWVTERSPMRGDAVAAIDAAGKASKSVFVSPISAWERGMLVASGRVTSPVSPKMWFERLLALPGMALAPLSIDVLTDSSFLPGPIHRDPADRIIIATARHHGMTIVTRDRAILEYGEAGHVMTMAC